ncbi:unnamed protein product [Miscanthus lutarioriparius]|uniref:Annexin n=1 Tax=Miscanthus lutarioriparius TaxID=422564 RepID=A0A811NAY2_9POAL|nr:unnamed protein product [Miscanthus lutarioriparius]
MGRFGVTRLALAPPALLAIVRTAEEVNASAMVLKVIRRTKVGINDQRVLDVIASALSNFIEAISYSILGFGTVEDTLTRVIISGSKIGMNKIKEEYKVRFKTTVTSDIVGDTSGYYKDFLLTLIGSED